MNIVQCEFQQLGMAGVLVTFRALISVACLFVHLPTVAVIPSRIGNCPNYFVDTLAFSATGVHVADSPPKEGYPYV